MEKGGPPMEAGTTVLQPTEGEAVVGAFSPTQNTLPGIW